MKYSTVPPIRLGRCRLTKDRSIGNSLTHFIARGTPGPCCGTRFGVCPPFSTNSVPLVVRSFAVWGLSPFPDQMHPQRRHCRSATARPRWNPSLQRTVGCQTLRGLGSVPFSRRNRDKLFCLETAERHRARHEALYRARRHPLHRPKGEQRIAQAFRPGRLMKRESP